MDNASAHPPYGTDWPSVIRDFHDVVAPKLDTYQQAIYWYLLRHSRVEDLPRVKVGFKSARKKIARGVGKADTAMSEGTAYEKLRDLEGLGLVTIEAVEHRGTVVKVFLPQEVEWVRIARLGPGPAPAEPEDFFEIESNRQRVFRREGGRCFYCTRKVSKDTVVIEHVRSRPEGDNSGTNVVAACRTCNNRKGSRSADDLLRLLYRDGLLDDSEFAAARERLRALAAGELLPE